MDGKTVGQISQEFSQASPQELEELIKAYQEDSRSGVVSLIKKYQRQLEKLEKERERLEEMRFYEHEYASWGLLAGIDEVGRGPLAGPVMTCACILPVDCEILYVNDSKQLSIKKREELFDQLQEVALCYAFGQVENERIDEINILNATWEAMRQAIEGLKVKPGGILVDGKPIPNLSLPQHGIIQGDAKSVSIAAASILAKVTRDRIMDEYDKVYPQYGFAKNKGYGTREHIEAIQKYGPCPIHRRSFITHFI